MKRRYLIPFYGLGCMIHDSSRFYSTSLSEDIKFVLALAFQMCLMIVLAFGICMAVA